jgi:hypothetical protein
MNKNHEPLTAQVIALNWTLAFLSFLFSWRQYSQLFHLLKKTPFMHYLRHKNYWVPELKVIIMGIVRLYWLLKTTKLAPEKDFWLSINWTLLTTEKNPIWTWKLSDQIKRTWEKIRTSKQTEWKIFQKKTTSKTSSDLIYLKRQFKNLKRFIFLFVFPDEKCYPPSSLSKREPKDTIKIN